MTRVTQYAGTNTELFEIMSPERILGEGSFAVVYQQTPGTVLKVTSCRYSKAFYEHLFELGRSGSAPEGLPLVIECHGLVGRDSDNLKYYGFTLERLLSLDDYAITDPRPIRAEISKIARQSRANLPGALITQCALAQGRRQIELAQEMSFAVESACVQDQISWLASRLTGSLQSGLQSLDFLMRAGKLKFAKLDLAEPSNIMMTAWGLPTLADPVAIGAYLDEPADRIDFDVVWALVPIQQSGHRVIARWRCYMPNELLASSAIKAVQTQWLSAESEKIKRAPACELSIWDVLKLTGNVAPQIDSEAGYTLAIPATRLPASTTRPALKAKVALAA